MSTPSSPSSGLSPSSTPPVRGVSTPTSSNSPAHSQTASPMMTLFRFLHSPGGSTSSSSASPALTPSMPSSPLAPFSRTLSDPTFNLNSPVLGTHGHGTMPPKLQRTRSLEADPFRLPESVGGVLASGTGGGSVPSSPAVPFRTFTVQSGFPAAEAQKKHGNGFLELLCKQDSFMNSD